MRLAGKLLNVKIDIKSEEDKKREVETALAQMAVREEGIDKLGGLGAKTGEAIVAAGFKTVGDVADAGLEGLTEVPGVGIKTAEKIYPEVHCRYRSAARQFPQFLDGLLNLQTQ